MAGKAARNIDSTSPVIERLLAENEALRARLEEADDTLAAIRRGDVDALVVGDDIYTLDSASATTSMLRRDVLAQMEDAVLAFDNDEHVIFMNPAAERHYRRAASEALGRSRSEIYQEKWPDPAEQKAARAELDSHGTCRVRSIHISDDGRRVHVESTIARLRDAAGLEIGYLSVVRNIDDRVRAEEVMHDADRRKDEFLATLAHELRNPLAPIQNALEIMKLTRDAAAQENARGIIERQHQQMVHLVNDLLDVSRISQGKLELRFENVDVATIVQTAIETSRPVIDAGRHELAVRLPAPGEMTIRADITRACQIVANLLNNAAKYTPERGRIEISAEREGHNVLITVGDSGVGIPPVLLPRIFDMFTQVDRSLTRAQGGLGIGLALVKRLVEMHGGTVEAHSEGDGHGCSFQVRLPFDESLTSSKTPTPVREGRATSATDTRVLVVDDNVDSAESLSQLLGMLGYQTRVEHDGEAGLQIAASYRPQVAVIDIGLPKMSGLDVAKQIRQQPWGKDILLVALSGWGQDEVRRQSREAGFDHHLVKPLELDALTSLLDQLDARE